MTAITLVYTKWRQEERLLVEAAEKQGLSLQPVRDADLMLGPDGPGVGGDAVLMRSLGAARAMSILRHLRAQGVPAVNPFETAAVCSDKQETTLRLRQAGISVPRSRVAYTEQSALAAAEDLGYPLVLKPTVGSWARLVARADDEDQLAQLLEHRAAMPNPAQHVYYLQQYVDKKSEAGHADLRVFVVGDEVVAAIRRTAPHWVTNTARGAQAENQPVTDELREMSLAAAEALGGGVLALDLFETPDGLMVNEANHNMEFKNSIEPTGVDIPARILSHTVEVARR